MRDILNLCIDLDRQAYEIYLALSQTCTDPEFATCFGQLAAEEKTHVGWWCGLLEAFDAGLVPDIVDEADVLERLTAVRDGLAETVPDDCEALSPDEMLELAVRFEFFMLDPLFAELLDLMQPGSTTDLRDSYARHVMRLIGLIENRYSRPGLGAFLAGVLRRAFADQQRLAAAVIHDQLTSLYNRRGMLGYLRQWLAWSHRYSHPLGVVLLDIDRFKRINDTLGHSAGDEALVVVSRALEDAVRASDLIGRFGGDEFLVIAPEVGGAEFDALLARLVSSVAATQLVVDDMNVPLSISVGGAWVAGGTTISVEEVIAQADRAMYRAKETGRAERGAVPHHTEATSA